MLLAALLVRPVDTDEIKRLIPGTTDEDKRKSLDYAITNDSLVLLRILTQGGIDINAPDFAGYTPLHQAVLHGKTKLVAKILELGGDPKRRDYQFETPVDIALKYKKIDIIRILENKPDLSLEEAKKIPGYGVKEDVDYSQNMLNNKLITFLNQRSKIELKEAQKHQKSKETKDQQEIETRELFVNKEGNCNGWAFLDQYYIGLDSEDEFYDILKCISRWDPVKQPEPYDVMLSDIKDISPKIATKYRTLGKLLSLTVNDLVWFQQAELLASQTTLKQHERIKQWEAIKRRDEKIELKEIFSLKNPNFEEVGIKEMLEFARRWPNSWIDIGIRGKSDNKGHAISVYVTSTGKFKFYDSNRRKRLPEIESAEIVGNFIMGALRKESVITGFDLYRFYPSNQPIPKVVEPTVLVDEGRYSNDSGKYLLNDFAASGQIDLVKKILKEGGLHFIKTKDKQIVTVLSRLAMVKQDNELQLTLNQNGIEFDPKIYADSAKIALAQGEIKSLVKIFEIGEIKKDALNNRDDDDLAALHIAISQGDRDSVKDLLRLGADKELLHNHETPLYQAARLGQHKIVSKLLKNKTNINFQKSGYGQDVGFSPLHIAIRDGHVKVAEILLLKGADFTLKDKNSQTAFEIKPKQNQAEMDSLIEKFNKGLLVEHHKHKRKAPIIVKAADRPLPIVQDSISMDQKKKSGPNIE